MPGMAIIGSKDKKYGLIVRRKDQQQQQQQPPAPRPSVFGDDDSDDDREFDAKFKSFDTRKETMRAQMKKQTQVGVEAALAEDPSVFEYDALYDDMHADRQRKAEERRGAADRKPKYMARLLRTAHERQLDRELQNDRKVQQELEAEGDQFKDKEKFVTAAYQRKMAELREMEERRRQEALVEDAFDVTKQDGLGGFYKYMMHSRDKPAAEKEAGDEEGKERKEEPGKKAKEDEEKEEERRRQRRREEERPRPRERSRSPPARQDEAEKRRKEEERAQEAADVRTLFARRADDAKVEEAKARYLARRQRRPQAAPVEPDSD